MPSMANPQVIPIRLFNISYFTLAQNSKQCAIFKMAKQNIQYVYLDL